jgi:oligopeptide transport system substrate-binding protein
MRFRERETEGVLRKRLSVGLSLTALVTGLVLIGAACGGSSGSSSTSSSAASGGGTTSQGKPGGTMKIVLADDTDYVDPALAYYQVSWQFQYSTCLKLLNYPDASGDQSAQLTPDAATGMPTVSSDGKTYTFTVKPGFKFSDGSGEATAANFKYAIERDLNPKMQSPAASFISDISGAKAFVDGKAKEVTGVKASGDTLTITLDKAAPDFISRIAMPFFCAIPTTTPIDPKGVKSLPSAGPYYVDSWTPNKSLVIKRNPNYGGQRPHFLDEIDYQMGVDPNQAVLLVKQGNADYIGDGTPPEQNAQLGAQFGPDSPVNGTDQQQFFVNPILSVSYEAMNTTRPNFNNELVRQAVNFAIDRPSILDQSGKYAGTPTDQMLPPGIAGYKDAQIYPLDGPDVAKAKALLAQSGVKTPFDAVLYTCDTAPCPERAQVIQQNLKAIGINVKIKQFSRQIQFQKEGVKGEPFDIADEGWFADYADPYDFINILLDGSNIQNTGNVNFSYFTDPTWQKKMQDAAGLSGDQRYSTYGQLDIDISKGPAPWASRANTNQIDFFSSRIGGLTFQAVYGMDYNLMYLK